jgi:hypothetical protein
MKTITITKKETNYILDLAKKRHDAKPNSIKNTGILINRNLSNPIENYLPHFIGIVGEYAWAKHTNRFVDEEIYEIRDSEDFDGEEIKTITYYGFGEPELKIKVTEFHCKEPKKYILARTNKDKILKSLINNDEKDIDVELLGIISRDDFNKKKTKKQYGANNPLNYVVSLSNMNIL